MKWGWKIPTFWLLGAIALLLGSMIAGEAQNHQGVELAVRVMVALLLFLVGGMFWMSIAVAVKNKL